MAEAHYYSRGGQEKELLRGNQTRDTGTSGQDCACTEGCFSRKTGKIGATGTATATGLLALMFMAAIGRAFLRNQGCWACAGT